MSSYSVELFEELWCKYYRRIFWYFRRQFDEHTAEDLCQQTYMNAWRHISVYENVNIRQSKSWLFTVARNVKNDHLRYIKLNNMNFNYNCLYEADIPVETKMEECIDIQKAFEALPEEEQELLSMAQYLTSKEIGSVLGISASAVRNRIQKAKEHLNKTLEDYGVSI